MESPNCCKPLKNLCDVSEWESKVNHLEKGANFQHAPIRKCDRPRTLVCHDMKGGYLNDRFVDGCNDIESYRFYHWSQIDIFVYFSHHFVTIPPKCWIDAGHLHSVPVLGTLITEWDDGAKICKNFLVEQHTYENLADALVSLAARLNFDGWLINIENKIEEHRVGNLVNFARLLTEKMHRMNTNSYVIWYDSVISSGELKWQNELNIENRHFFDVCDGIFLNYNWKDDNLANTVVEAGQSRLKDVYVGVDVFGRGCLRGGGFNTDIAMKAIRDKGLSAAIFAHGWVYEVLGADNFTDNENKFWSKLSKYCHHRNVGNLPIKSSFCQGFGQRKFRKGSVTSCEPWFNLRLQEFQPTFHSTCSVKSTSCELNYFTLDAFNGGGCLNLRGKCLNDEYHKYFKLFQCEINLDSSLDASYAIKVLKCDAKCNISLVLKFLSVDSGRKVIRCGDSSVSDDAKCIRDEFLNGWTIRKYNIAYETFGNGTFVEIGIEVNLMSEDEFNFLLGTIEVDTSTTSV